MPLSLGGYPCFDDSIVCEFLQGVPNGVVFAKLGNVVGVEPLSLPLVSV